MAKSNMLNLIVTVEQEPASTYAYEAYNEEPRVFCSHGPTPTAALKAMAKILKKEDIEFWTAASVNFDDEGIFYMTVFA